MPQDSVSDPEPFGGQESTLIQENGGCSNVLCLSLWFTLESAVHSWLGAQGPPIKFRSFKLALSGTRFNHYQWLCGLICKMNPNLLQIGGAGMWCF